MTTCEQPRRCNAAGRALIQRFETCRLEAYRCPAGIWTIGWGETGSGIERGTRWSQAYADRRFELALVERERAVDKLLSVPVNLNEYSALVSLAYNIGLGNFAQSTLLRKLNGGRPRDEVAEEFGRWTRAGGKILNGLIRRRAAERDLFLTPDTLR